MDLRMKIVKRREGDVSESVDRTVSPSRNLLARKGAPVDSSVDEVVHLRLLCHGECASAQQGKLNLSLEVPLTRSTWPAIIQIS